MLALLLSAAALLGQQQATGDSLLAVSRYLDLEDVGDAKVSPDGKTIVYTRRWVDKVNDKWESAIWIIDSDGSRNRFLVKGGGPVWSPDGSRIAYVAPAEEPKGAQIFVRWMDSEGATSQITRLPEGPASLKWSPDGKWIGFVMFTPKSDDWAIDMPSAPANGKWTAPPRVVNRLHYRLDRSGYTRTGFNHIFIVPADGGSARELTTGDWSVGAPFDALTFGAAWDWMPDGKTIVTDGFAENDGDMNYRDSNIYAIDVATGARKRLTPERGRWSGPVVSPDGSRIAFAGHTFTKQTYHTQDLMLMNPDGSGVKNISGGMDRDPGFTPPIWAPDGSGLFLAPEDKGSRNVIFLPVDGSGPKPVTTGAQVITLGGITKTGVLVGTRSNFTSPEDVVRITRTRTGSDVVQLTNVNEDLLAGKKLATAEEIWYTSSGGARVQGWIVKPIGFEPGKQYPMLLEIHGGPHGMYSVGFDYMWQTWAANGYVVLYTNPRGSTGYGTAFGNAIDQAYPSVDYDDLMAGVDSVIGRGYVDKSRMYVAGCSGGGVLSSWVIGHTDRFAGAAVRCPVTNWLSFVGTTDGASWYRNFDRLPWEDPSEHLRRSPLMYVGNVKTPTMLMTGVNDLRTPMGQTEEFYEALKYRKVPTAMVRFNDEWHGTTSKPSNFIRSQLYLRDWFKKHARPSAAVSDGQH